MNTMYQLLSQGKLALAAALTSLIFGSLNLQSTFAADIPVDCGFAAARGGNREQEVRILGNDFPALHGLIAAVAHCNGKQPISAELTQSYRDLQLPALSANPAGFDVVITGNNAIVPLLNDGLLQPLDHLIEKHIPQLSVRNRVTFDSQTMAIAFLVNSQHLYARKDVLNSIDSGIPTTFSQMISVCEQLQKQTDTPYPLIAAFEAGWDLGLEFINHYLAEGGSHENSVNNTAGTRALANLKAMSRCMHPDFLSRGINDIQAEWQAGNAALAFYGDRVHDLLLNQAIRYLW